MASRAKRGIRTALLLTTTAAGTNATAVLASAHPARPSAVATSPAGVSRTRPNVVVILADDLGFSDLSCYGGEIPTPNLDALARGGLRFTQFYNAARCSPSRASLLTGLYPHQAGVGHLEEMVVPGSRGLQGRLADRAVTLAEVLRGAGYLTAMAGKWHVGITHGLGPWQRGFDRSIVPPLGGLYFPDQTSKYRTSVYIDGREVPTSAEEVGQGHWYASDLWVDWGTRFIGEATAQHKPFFLYLPFTAPHFPLMAPPEDIARFRGRYRIGWDALRQARFDRQKRLGIIGAGETLTPRLPATDDWARLTPDERDRFDAIMAIYAADVSRLDRAVGTLVARLKASHQFDNTLILFLSDNGGSAESGPAGRAEGASLGDARSNVMAGMNWATLQNTPFAFFKHYTREGGIAAPLIVSWPNGIRPKLDGGLVRASSDVIDVMPTLVAVSGARYPTTFDGHAILPMQGRSLTPAFSGAPLARDRPLFWEHEGNRAVRDGRWKAVARFLRPWEVYDMATDRTETRDVAGTHPALIRRMAARWDRWAAASDVDPWRDGFDASLHGEPRGDWGGPISEASKRED